MVGLRTWGLVLAAIAFAGCRPAIQDTTELPMTLLWAWERPEDLRFVDPAEVGIAFLAATLVLAGDDVEITPRMQPLRTPEGTALVAVVRVEALQPALTREQALAAADAIAGEIAGRAELAAVQLDFDSTMSQRDFHRDLLTQLRDRLPDGLPLTMTALASWCLHDDWLEGLPVAAAVPMFFDMGVDAGWVDRHLAGGGDVLSEICRGDVGRATYGPGPTLSGDRRTWWFHDEAWSRDALERVKEEVP
jgi:hypothetical protein